jgi:hypothetical protein
MTYLSPKASILFNNAEYEYEKNECLLTKEERQQQINNLASSKCYSASFQRDNDSKSGRNYNTDIDHSNYNDRHRPL